MNKEILDCGSQGLAWPDGHRIHRPVRERGLGPRLLGFGLIAVLLRSGLPLGHGRVPRRGFHTSLLSCGRATPHPGGPWGFQGAKTSSWVSLVSGGWGECTAPRVGQGQVQERPSSSIEGTLPGVSVDAACHLQEDFIKRTKAHAGHRAVHWAMWGFWE